MCCVCLEKEAIMINIECGHKSMCDECEKHYESGN